MTPTTAMTPMTVFATTAISSPRGRQVRTARHPHNMMLAGARPLEYWTTQYQRDAAVCSATTWSATPHVASPQATALGKWSWPPEAARPRVMLALPPSLDPAAPS